MHYGAFKLVESAGGSYRYFLPSHMTSNWINIDQFIKQSEEITQLLGKLDAMMQFLPDKSLFIYMYVRKEALLSSQIEGTQSSLHDIFAHEQQLPLRDGTPDDIEEVSQYIKAITYGTDTIKKGSLPFSVRLLKNIHFELMQGVRGSTKDPGEIRKTQNWIGGTRPGNALFVPPAPEHVVDLLSDMEKFYHNSALPTPVLCGMLHGHFETIHPFLDGNGRLGRLMIPLILCDQNLISDPVLYMSYNLKVYRDSYYKHLQNLRDNGDWNGWMVFFLSALKESVSDAYLNCLRIQKLLSTDEQKIKTLPRSENIYRIFEYMKKMPLLHIPSVVKALKISPHTVKKSLEVLIENGIIVSIDDRKRDREYMYKAYYDILNSEAIRET